MLTKDLMRVSIRKGVVKPGWLDATAERDLERAARLVQIFEAHVGARKSELDEVLAVETGSERDFRTRRGLAKLLWDRCELSVAGALVPGEVRAVVFETAATIPMSEPDRRQRALESAASHFECEVSAITEALYADLSANQRVLSLKPITPEQLVHRYNVALAQGVVLQSSGLTIRVDDCGTKRLRQLLRFLKFHRLMFEATRTGARWVFTVDGPTSVFKHSTRYGLQLANFLPALLLCEDWTLEAEYEPKRGRSARLSLSSSDGLVSHYRDTGTWIADEETALAKRLKDLADGWRVDTRASLVDLDGRGVLVPDLVLREGSRKALLEVVWRWRKGSLASRLALLEAHGPPNLILAVCTSGQDEALPELPGPVHCFKHTPSARAIWKLARDIAE